MVFSTAAPTPAFAQETQPPADSTHKAVRPVGRWIGSRLQCRKDESGPVKCGTPAAFAIVFRENGTGSCQGSDFPAEFSYEPGEGSAMIIFSADRQRRWELFDFKVEGEFLSFQAYIYPPGTAKGSSEEYIHYVYDLTRENPDPASTEKK